MRGKIILITGGAGLLGSTFSRAIYSSGGIPIIADRNPAAAEKTCRDLSPKEALGPKPDWLELDIASGASWKSGLDAIRTRHGKLDAVVNAAYPRGAGYGKAFEDISYAEFCETMNLHLGGIFLSNQQTGTFFCEQGYGNIINLASIYGVIAPRFEIYKGTKMGNPIEYGAMKAAIIHMTKYLAKYYKDKHVRVNCISPGGILDNQTDSFLQNYRSFCLSKGMLDKEDLNGALLFLLSDGSSGMNGQNLVVDDGFTL